MGFEITKINDSNEAYKMISLSSEVSETFALGMRKALILQ